MRKFLLSLFLLATFVATAQAQSVATEEQAQSENTLVQQGVSSTGPEEANPDGLDQDIREEFTLRLKRRYKDMSLKELEKRKKYVEKQISRKANSKNVALKEKLDIELEIVNEAIEQAKQPATQE